ncbi:MAG: hypothetical protein ABFE02_04640 [Sulfuricella sp.]
MGTPEAVTAYPLTWPAGQPRLTAQQRRRNWSFSKIRTIAVARDELLMELKRLGASRVVISSNLRLRGDGLPMGNQAAPADPGVAVYFRLAGQAVVMACDRWDRPEQNLWAIRLHIEALRGTERWGVGKANQAFTGYRALPDARTNVAMSLEEAADFIIRKGYMEGVPEARNGVIGHPHILAGIYKVASKTCHPDTGGTHEDFVRLQEAKRVLDEHHAHKGVA